MIEAGKVKGPQGDPGPQGPRGETGQTGPQGPRGETGQRGPQGEIGQTGQTGPAGQDGHTPVKGVDYWTASDKQEIYAEAEQALRDQEQSSIAAIREAGADEVEKVQIKGTEVLESIPEDYAALTTEVSGLKSDLSEYAKVLTVGNLKEKTVASSVIGVKLNQWGQSLDSDYNVKTYALTEPLYIRTNYAYQMRETTSAGTYKTTVFGEFEGFVYPADGVGYIAVNVPHDNPSEYGAFSIISIADNMLNVTTNVSQLLNLNQRTVQTTIHHHLPMKKWGICLLENC